MAFIAVPLSFRQIRPPRRTQRPRRRQDGNLWTCCYAAQSSITRPAAEPAGDPVAIGQAILIVMVRVLAFSKSVSLQVERQFTTQGSGLALAADPIPLADWREYCDAFAPV
jgi:hypothetical protein